MDDYADFSTHIDTIMHLVFLGVSQKVGMIIKTILNKLMKYTAFSSNGNHFEIIKDMNLDWCKCLPFGSKEKPFGSWVSENTLAYVRIIKCVYGVLDDEINDEDVSESIIYLAHIWQGTVARIMQNSVIDKYINDTERHIKLFLSTIRDAENCYELEEKGNKTTKALLHSTSNLSGLLNLPDFMRDYGPLRLYWEGGCIGEGIVKYIKPCITQGTHKPNFANTAMK